MANCNPLTVVLELSPGEATAICALTGAALPRGDFAQEVDAVYCALRRAGVKCDDVRVHINSGVYLERVRE